jgi:hypothetical protein
MSDVSAAFLGQSVILPTGQVVSGKPLPFGVALSCMDAFAAYEQATTSAEQAKIMRQMFADFTKAVDLQNADALNDLTLAEACDVIRRFFTYRRPTPSPTPTDPPT